MEGHPPLNPYLQSKPDNSNVNTVPIRVPENNIYSKSHFKSVTFALHVFRSFHNQFSSDFHEIWQALVSSLTAPAPKISGKNIMKFKS